MRIHLTPGQGVSWWDDTERLESAMRIPAKDRKEQLIAATVELMRSEGVQSVTIRAIAKESNAPLASAYYCFGNKDELMDAAAEAWFQHMSRFSSDVPVHAGLRTAVEHVAEAYWRSLEEEPADILAQMELILWATRNAADSRLATKIYPEYEIELGKIFSLAAQNSGEQSLIDAPLLVRSFLLVFEGAAIQCMADPDAIDHRALFFLMIDAILLKAGV